MSYSIKIRPIRISMHKILEDVDPEILGGASKKIKKKKNTPK